MFGLPSQASKLSTYSRRGIRLWHSSTRDLKTVSSLVLLTLPQFSAHDSFMCTQCEIHRPTEAHHRERGQQRKDPCLFLVQLRSGVNSVHHFPKRRSNLGERIAPSTCRWNRHWHLPCVLDLFFTIHITRPPCLFSTAAIHTWPKLQPLPIQYRPCPKSNSCLRWPAPNLTTQVIGAKPRPQQVGQHGSRT